LDIKDRKASVGMKVRRGRERRIQTGRRREFHEIKVFL